MGGDQQIGAKIVEGQLLFHPVVRDILESPAVRGVLAVP